MLDCNAGPRELPLDPRLISSVTGCRLCQEGTALGRVSLEPRLAPKELGIESLPDRAPGAPPCPPRRQCPPHRVSVVDVETCHTCIFRKDLSQPLQVQPFWTSIGRKAPGELPTNICCHLMSWGLEATQTFPGTMLQGF